MDGDYKDDEFKIVEPKKDKKPDLEVKVLKVQGAVTAVMVKLIMQKGEDLDVDNMFNLKDPNGKDVCILTDSIPCKNPHCMSCNMMHFYDEKADDVISVLSDKLAKDMLRKCRKEMSDARKQVIDGMMKVVMRAIEGESKDE